MVLYNVTTVANSTGLLDFMSNVNSQLMQGWFFSLMLIAIFAILLMAFLHSTGSAGQSFAAASFICFGLSIFLLALGLVPEIAFIACLLMASFSVAMLKKRD